VHNIVEKTINRERKAYLDEWLWIVSGWAIQQWQKTRESAMGSAAGARANSFRLGFLISLGKKKYYIYIYIYCSYFWWIDYRFTTSPSRKSNMCYRTQADLAARVRTGVAQP
jgi:hypothetical protein